MKQLIETTFPQSRTGNCIDTEKGDFQVFDSETEPKRCYIRRSEEELVHFKVLNPNQKEIHFRY